MTHRVLVSAPYMLPVVDRFRPRFEAEGAEIVIVDVEERLEEEELLEVIGDIDGVICGDDRFTERVLKAAPRLKVISKWGTGVDSIDGPAAERLGIRVCRTPNAFTEPVSDTVLGYVLSFARSLPSMADAMRNGVWKKIPGVSLSESVLGIVGVGNIGRAVARRAAAFGMRILGTDPAAIPAEVREATGLEPVSLERLLAESDFVSLNCDLNPTSHHLMSDPEFEAMKPTAVLVNTARGPVVDEGALVRALTAGRIAGAGLDVFEVEPLPADSPLRRMSNVMLAPHNSNSSPRAWERVHENTLRNLFEGLRENV